MRKVVAEGGWVVLDDKDEVEAKFHIAPQDTVKIGNKLAALGFKNCGEVSQTDLYFNILMGYFDANIGYLRLRTENERCTLTFKGLPVHRKGIKMRKELGVELKSPGEGSMLEEILMELKMNPSKKIDKTREEWRKDNKRVFLDDVRGIGTFIEIEISGGGYKSIENEIGSLRQELGLPNPIEESYLELSK